jgi:type IV pilus assembly protein PilW
MTSKGFTLVEVLMAMLVSGIVLSAVLTSFQSQQHTYLVQDQVVEMQQNARIAVDMLARDIRSAGYDPDGLGAGITTATSQTLTFTRSDNSGGLETIAYSLFDAFVSIGQNDGVEDDLARQVTNATGGSAGRQPVAENIRFLEFNYLDMDGNTTDVLTDIRAVQISILAQSAGPEPRLNPPRPVYETPGGQEWQADPGFLSRFLTTAVICRNLGL